MDDRYDFEGVPLPDPRNTDVEVDENVATWQQLKDFLESLETEEVGQEMYHMRVNNASHRDYGLSADELNMLVEIGEPSEDKLQLLNHLFPEHSIDFLSEYYHKYQLYNRKPRMWVETEDRALVRYAYMCGGDWEVVSLYMPGRIPSSCFNRYDFLCSLQ